MLVDGKRGFIMVDFGQFYLLKAKIMLEQFCRKFEIRFEFVEVENENETN